MIAALSIVAVFFFTYLSLLSLWLLISFRAVSTLREKRDTAATALLSLAYVTLHAMAFSRAGECTPTWSAAASILITLGLGWYIERSLERRLSWYQFCRQEEAKLAVSSKG